MKFDSPGRHNRRGFTLLELLITIGVMGILAAIVIIAINPQKQLEDARDAQRRTDVNTILNAVTQFQIKEWRLPMRDGLPPTDIPLGQENKMDICELPIPFTCFLPPRKAYLYELVQFDYVTTLPQDPADDDAKGTGYEIWRTADNRVHVCAPHFSKGGCDGLTVSK
jgi:prepilin-type N-terminal cleavage/methylation domain-containing protein